MRFIVMALSFAVSGALADTEIYRCPLDDGTFAFQETPCPDPDEASDETQPEPEDPPPPAGAPRPERLSKDRAACEKETRDAIDAIDLEMRETRYSQEQGEQYLVELLELTRQLRACKQL